MCFLPVALFSETSGSFVNTEGRIAVLHPVVRSLGESRPAWKVLRLLGNLLGLTGFRLRHTESVRDDACPRESLASRLDNCRQRYRKLSPEGASGALQRVADVPIYFADGIVRRRDALQNAGDSRAPHARVHPRPSGVLASPQGRACRVRQGAGEACSKPPPMKACRPVACALPARMNRRPVWDPCSARSAWRATQPMSSGAGPTGQDDE